jgi:hypothetical protein
MPYSHLTWLQLRQALASRNQDAGNVYWSDAENKILLTEALRVWQAMTSFSRARVSFDSSANTSFYDLTSVVSSVLGYNVKDIDLITAISLHLLETNPAGLGTAGAAWAGTTMFTLDLVVKAIERRRNLFLADTGCVLTRAVVGVPSPPIGRVPLSDSVIAVRRVAWSAPSVAAATAYLPLWQQDAWAANAFAVGWPNAPGTPLSFSIIEDIPLELQLIPPPASTSQLDLVSVSTGARLDATVGVLLGVPDNWSWAVKWGALADLLEQDGQAQDLAQASYCEQRYQEAVALCRDTEVILQAQLRGQPVFVDSLSDLDAFSPGWQQNPGPPTGLGSAGPNLIVLAPTPDSAGPYSVLLDVVGNASLPVNDGDQVQVGREDIDAILALAQHTALFKEGSASVNDSLDLYRQFQIHAAHFNARIQAQSLFLPALAGQSHKEKARRSYMEPEI